MYLTQHAPRGAAFAHSAADARKLELRDGRPGDSGGRSLQPGEKAFELVVAAGRGAREGQVQRQLLVNAPRLAMTEVQQELRRSIKHVIPREEREFGTGGLTRVERGEECGFTIGATFANAGDDLHGAFLLGDGIAQEYAPEFRRVQEQLPVPGDLALGIVEAERRAGSPFLPSVPVTTAVGDFGERREMKRVKRFGVGIGRNGQREMQNEGACGNRLDFLAHRFRELVRLEGAGGVEAVARGKVEGARDFRELFALHGIDSASGRASGTTALSEGERGLSIGEVDRRDCPMRIRQHHRRVVLSHHGAPEAVKRGDTPFHSQIRRPTSRDGNARRHLGMHEQEPVGQP